MLVIDLIQNSRRLQSPELETIEYCCFKLGASSNRMNIGLWVDGTGTKSPKKVFGPKLRGMDWLEKIRNWELHSSYPAPNIITSVEQKTEFTIARKIWGNDKWEQHVGQWISSSRDHQTESMRKCSQNVSWRTGCDDVDCIHLAQGEILWKWWLIFSFFKHNELVERLSNWAHRLSTAVPPPELN
jgi:hypothetical protein